MEIFTAIYNGVKVYGKWTDWTRPTCGHIFNDGYDFELVTTCQLENVKSHDCYHSAMKEIR